MQSREELRETVREAVRQSREAANAARAAAQAAGGPPELPLVPGVPAPYAAELLRQEIDFARAEVGRLTSLLADGRARAQEDVIRGQLDAAASRLAALQARLDEMLAGTDQTPARPTTQPPPQLGQRAATGARDRHHEWLLHHQVERVSENQRYATNVMHDLRGLPAPNPLDGWPAAAQREPVSAERHTP